MKKLSPHLVFKVFWIVFFIGATIGLIGAWGVRSHRVMAIGMLIMVCAYVFRYSCYKCPACGQYLGRIRTDVCPHCGEKF